MLPPGIKNLLYANGAVFLLLFLNQTIGDYVFRLCAFSPQAVISSFAIWQFVTYMFLHGGFGHIFFNMFALWMFGADLERDWGTKEFLKYYFITGIGAALFYLIIMGTSAGSMVGASGAVYGILIAFALRFPDRELIIFPIFVPIKAKYFVLIFGGLAFLLTFGSDGSDNIAHAAHLGGMVVGYIYLKFWYQFFKLKSGLKNIFGKKPKNDLKYTKGGSDKTEYYRRVIDELLDKINRVGYLNLTEEEKKLLEEGSKYLREHNNNNYH
ncbi:MAG: rhomboid family intramembrane serine protease [Calditrichaceae bacterium]|nr:rhomboid family intramembrane serine protease [Calditrichaceae bacterium]MBN2709144.1 rhomboid family intramembrane serine protease [Calditrichaceae bacterium]RQV96100.1 MAG: rhomboid family intramembrane serine protease [Calditrichota bacterium]